MAWGGLLIWWGIVFMIDALTVGVGVAVSGLILLSLNAARAIKGIPPRRSTTSVGLIALVWGGLDHILSLSLGSSVGVLLIAIGLVVIAAPLLHRRSACDCGG